MKKKPKKYSIFNKKNSAYGRISALIALLGVIIFITALIISYMNRGNGGMIVGLLGLLTFMLSIAGFIVGMLGFKDDEKLQLFCWVGSISNAFIWLAIIGMILAFI